ncbi:MAG: hypothetical protein SPD47_07965 [Oscillospiraceae bacterium]|nr:hypothetical protein [Oscillospiraceae bacterium]
MEKPTLELFEKLSAEIGKSVDTNRTINSITDPEVKEYVKTCSTVVLKNTNVAALTASSAAISAAVGSAVALGGTAIGIGTGVTIGGASAVAAAGTGAAVGSAVPIIGTIIGGLVGLAIGATVGASVNAAQENKKKATYNEIIKKLDSVNRVLTAELKDKTAKLEALKQQNQMLETENRYLRNRIDYIIGILGSGEAAKQSLA